MAFAEYPIMLGMLLAAGAGGAILWRRLARRAPFSFEGTRALVTGGSRGLGLEIARALVREGVAGLAICARDPDTLARAREDLTSPACRVVAIPADVGDADEARSVVARTVDELGGLEVLVNTAGTISVGPLSVMTVEDFETAMRNNFWSALHTTLAALPVMRRQGGGRIVNVTSIGGRISVPHLVPYSASKFAAVGWSQGLRAELARERIVVTTVCPGLMRTGSPRHAEFKGRHRLEYAWFSISDALPGLSMSSERAAIAIVDACRRGDAELIMPLPARLASVVHGLAPGLTADVLGLVNRLLPGPGGVGAGRRKGHESESLVSPSPLTALGEAAARRNNQIA